MAPGLRRLETFTSSHLAARWRTSLATAVIDLELPTLRRRNILHSNNTTTTLPAASIPALLAVLLCAVIVLVLLVYVAIRRTRLFGRLSPGECRSHTRNQSTISAQSCSERPGRIVMVYSAAVAETGSSTHVCNLLRGQGNSCTSVQQPLLHSSEGPLSSSLELSGRSPYGTMQKSKEEESIHWHGSNLLNTTWGWMS